MPEFEVKITTPVELAGAIQLADALEKDIGKAKALGKETAELEKKLAAVNKAIANASDEAKKGEEGFRLFGRGAHEAHASIHALGEAIPGVTQVARFMESKLTAAIGLTVFLFGRFKEAAAAAFETLSNLANSPDARGEWIEAQRQAVERADVSFLSWEHAILRVQNATEQLRISTEQFISLQRGQLTAENEIANAQKELEEARIDLAVKLGQLTPEQAIKIKLELDEEAFKREAEIKIKELEIEINARIASAAHGVGDINDAASRVTQTEAAARAADAAKAKNDKKLEQDQRNLDESQKRQAEAQKTVDELEGKGAWGGKWDKTDVQYWQLKAAQDTVEAEQRRQALLKRSNAQEQGKQTSLDANAEKAKADQEDARKSYNDAKKQREDDKRKIDQLQQDLQIEKDKAAAIESLHNQTVETNADADQYEAAKKAFESGTATPNQLRFLRNNAGGPQDTADQTAWSRTPAPQIGNDLSHARAAVDLLGRHMASGGGSDPEARALLNEVIGLAQDLYATTAQKSDLQALEAKLEVIRSEIANHGSRLNQSANI